VAELLFRLEGRFHNLPVYSSEVRANDRLKLSFTFVVIVVEWFFGSSDTLQYLLSFKIIIELLATL